MDHKRLIFRVTWLSVIVLTLGLYLQSLHDFVIRVMGAIMIVVTILTLSFILGSRLGEGKNQYEQYKKSTSTSTDHSWRDSIRKLSGLGNGRH